jgi:D-alanine--poly(phosphoribitol) ligase subunit 1
MSLSNLIDDYFALSQIYLHDKKGFPVSTATVKSDYLRLICFIADNGYAPIGINLEFGYRYLIVILACMRMGVPYVPLRTSWPKARIQEIVDLVEIHLVIDDMNYRQMLDRYSQSELPPQPFLSTKSNENPAYIITTSGTTGKPKAVVISRGSIANYYFWLAGYFDQITIDDRILMITDFTFDISHIDIGLLLYKRMYLYFSKFNQNLNIFSLAAEIGEHNITVLNTVPNNMTLLLQDAIVRRANFSSLTHLILGGARFSSGTYSAVFEQLSDVNVFNMYGPTEATVYTHVAKLTGDVGRDMIESNVTIGLPISNMDACLVDQEGQVIEANGVNGHLYLSGIQLMTCYFDMEERTSEVIVTVQGVRCYKTGDLAYRDSGGRYFIIGRLDDTIKRRGFRVNLLDIDSYVQRLNYVQDSKTVALPSELHENLLITFVIPVGKVNEARLLSDLNELLPDQQIPDEIHFLESFPLNNAGKVSAQALIGLYKSN